MRRSVIRVRASIVLAAAVALATVGAPTVHAASTLYVGAGGGEGGCASPSYSTIADAVAAAASGDTVHVCAGTYVLASAVIVPVGLSFAGDGAETTIVDGGGTTMLFNATGPSLSVTGLTLRNGWGLTGGAIGAVGSVTVSKSTFSGNTADRMGGGIFTLGSVTVSDSTFSGNSATVDAGGGIFTSGSVTVTDSTFTGNSAANSGGAIYGPTVTVTDSTFNGNRVTGHEGGAIRTVGDVTVTGSTFSGNSAVGGGGAIHVPGGHTMVANSTFSGNSAGLGGALDVDSASVTNSTFSGNSALYGGGAIFPEGPGTSIANTVIMGTGSQCGGLLDMGGNLTTDDSCPGTLVTADALALGTLADNGGPTQTMAIGETSAARGAGQSAACLAAPVNGLDQRGAIRQDGDCDSGAYEYSPPSIDTFTPTQGPTGTVVRLVGVGFVGIRSIEFVHALATTWTVVDPWTIDVTVPDGAITGPIGITTADGTATSAGDFTVVRYPRVLSFTPSQGPAGTRVTITGLFFTGATAARIGATALADLRVVDGSTITGTVAPGTLTGKVSVTTPGGTHTSAQAFTVTLAPVAVGFSPLAGRVGSVVTISGAGLGYVRSVTIGGRAAAFTVRSPSAIVATVPAGAVSGKIVVTSPYGSATSALAFTVLP